MRDKFSFSVYADSLPYSVLIAVRRVSPLGLHSLSYKIIDNHTANLDRLAT